MENRLSRFIGFDDRKTKQEALRKAMESLPNGILYMIDSLKLQKLGRQAFAEYISKEMTPNQVMNNIIFNEDMYEDDVKIGRNTIRREFKKLLPGYDPFTEQYYESKGEEEESDEDDEYTPEEYNEDEIYGEEGNRKEEIQLEKWVEEYEDQNKTTEEWVKQYENSILDFFVSPSERQMIKNQLQNLLLEQKKFIVEKVLATKSLLNLNPENQRKYVMDFVKTLAKRGIQGSKY